MTTVTNQYRNNCPDCEGFVRQRDLARARLAAQDKELELLRRLAEIDRNDLAGMHPTARCGGVAEGCEICTRLHIHEELRALRKGEPSREGSADPDMADHTR